MRRAEAARHLALDTAPYSVRFVTHSDVGAQGVDLAIQALRQVVTKVPRERRMIRLAKKRAVLNFLILGLSCFCGGELRAQAPADAPPKKPTVNEAQVFVDDAEKQLFDLEIKAQRAAWVEENFITVDTEHMAADANQELTAKGVLLSRGTHRFESISLPPELARKILLLEISTLLPSPADPALQKELAGNMSLAPGSKSASLAGDGEGDSLGISWQSHQALL